MAEPQQITFTHKEVAEALIKQQDIHDGLWGLFIQFGLAAANLGPGPEALNPAAIVPVLKIGIQKFPEPNSLTADASVLNPAKSTAKQTKKRKTNGK